MGIDINAKYLQETKNRYSHLDNILECLCIDLMSEYNKLPHADMVLANLLIEYIGYDCFKEIIKHAQPQYVSCVIQINCDDTFVSDSPYLHVFDDLNKVHHQLDKVSLNKSMQEIHYHKIKEKEYLLPNDKKLLQLDYEEGS